MTKPRLVDVKSLRKRYGGTHVLNGVDVSADQGDVVSIVGSSGSGKSTLLRCINFLETPTSGDIAILGEPVRVTTRKGLSQPQDPAQVRRLRSRIGMVFQDFNLWSGKTIIENAIEAPIHVLKLSRREALERAERYLAKVGIYDKRDRYPCELSGGQQQRAAIARALCCEPMLMLFDEPTSALDPELVGEVLRVMRGLAAEGCTMLIVTHEMAFARDVSNKMIFLHAGKVEEAGSPADLFNGPRSAPLRRFLSH